MILTLATIQDLLVVGAIVLVAIAGGAFLEWNRRRNNHATDNHVDDHVVEKTVQKADQAEQYMRLAERRSRLELKEDEAQPSEDEQSE